MYFLTFAKAFDTIDHDILLAKLVHYGICVQALQWISSYCRKQYIQYKETFSSYHTIKCGVPSILGPLLILLYINSLTGNAPGCALRLARG